MPMAVQENLRGEFWTRVSGRSILQEFAKQKCLLAQPVRSRVTRKQVAQLVPKNGGTTRLEHNDWQAGVNLCTEGIHDFFKVSLCFGQHSEVIQRPSATQNIRCASHRQTSWLEHFQSGAACFWMKIIIERDEPPQDFALFRDIIF